MGNNVGWPPFTEQGLVGPRTLGTIRQMGHPAVLGPAHVQWKRDHPHRATHRKARQSVRDYKHPPSTRSPVGERHDRDSGQLMPGRSQHSLSGVQGRRDPTVLIGRQRRARRTRTTRHLALREPALITRTSQKSRPHIMLLGIRFDTLCKSRDAGQTVERLTHRRGNCWKAEVERAAVSAVGAWLGDRRFRGAVPDVHDRRRVVSPRRCRWIGLPPGFS